MLSRDADAIYWMSRHYDRARGDLTARFHRREPSSLTLELIPAGQRPSWEPLVLTTSAITSGSSNTYDGRSDTRRRDEISPRSTTSTEFDPLPACRRARENARSVREINNASRMWQQL
jgi:uncharacterized alpha-E superfamily protein